MKIIQGAVRYPVTTSVGVILVVLFGVIAAFRLPVQLTPNVEEPTVTVQTVWPGASPQEVEREIVDEQEEQLKSVEGMVKMESSSNDGYGSVVLTFRVGADREAALLRVANALEQVPSYPEDADKPVIFSSDPDADALAWFVIHPRADGGFDGDITTLFDFVDDFVKPELERVPGVSRSNVYGGREREMQVLVDPAKLAARQVTLNELAAALERENRNYSAGDFDEGKRRYVVRTVGEYESEQDVEDIVVAVRNGVPVYLRDVGRARLDFHKPVARVFQKGQPVLAANAIREPGTNILEVMQGVRETVAALNAGRLRDAGLEMIQVSDQTEYIVSAIGLVRQSLGIGAVLAVIVLLLYLRSFPPTLVITVAIPVSLIGATLCMFVFGRTINVVSLAGMAFAVGMVVDNSIVVLENIYRHRQMGKRRFDAAYDGAREVWGAVLASTLTTIAVFVPIVFLAGEVGQLFGDIAIALSCAVAISLAVSITVIPSMSAKVMNVVEHKPGERGFFNLWGLLHTARGATNKVADFVYWITGSTTRRLALVLVLTVVSVGMSWLLIPDTEYLPGGNQNWLFGYVIPPPGYSIGEVADAERLLREEIQPLWESEPGTPQAEATPGGGIRNYFYVALNNIGFMGARSHDPMRARELIPVFFGAGGKIPGMYFFISQPSIFQRGFGEGRAINIVLTGPDLDRLVQIGGQVFARAPGVLGEGVQLRPDPPQGLEGGNPELRVRTHRRRAAELGIANRDLGFAVNALVDGAKASDFLYQGKEIDLTVMSEGSYVPRTHLLEELPLATPDGRLVTLGSVADIELVTGPAQINHFERQRNLTIVVEPRREMAIETAMRKIEQEVLEPLREEGLLGGLYQATLSGSADKLTQTRRAVQWNFALALAITYLLMAALFESFLYPFVIMFSVPLAALGGFLGLGLLHWVDPTQQLDVLTMLGFIILVGTVVNNAILIVHQSLNHMRDEAMAPREAIRESVRNRIRPIFMSVSTSVFAMLPLVLFPGAGSELYRGLGSVVVGGLVVSTVFTLFLVPALFSLTLDARAALAGRLRAALGPDEKPGDVTT